MKDKCCSGLKTLTGKKFIVFTKRGNNSIKASLKLLKNEGYKKVLIQDQGGWMTYPQFIKKFNFEEIRLKTDYGLIKNKDLDKHHDNVLLINSMPGYFAIQNMKTIFEKCKQKNIFLLNDVSGSIGTKEAFFGDIIFGSLNRWKPLSIDTGGFIAFNNHKYLDFFKSFEEELDWDLLNKKISELKDRINMLKTNCSNIKKELTTFEIIHKEHNGLNVIIKFTSESEKEKLIKYCDEKKLEYVECPKYIRVLEKAISIEVKRL